MKKLISKIRTLLRIRRKDADDNIERPEPDKFLYVFQDFTFGIIIAVFFAMLTYVIMNGSLAVWIGTYLAGIEIDAAFEERLALFTAVLFLLVSLVVIFGGYEAGCEFLKSVFS